MTIFTDNAQLLAQDFAKRLGGSLGQALAGSGADGADLPARIVEAAAEPTARYREKVRAAWPVDDIGAAAAHFVLANLAVPHNLEVITKHQCVADALVDELR